MTRLTRVTASVAAGIAAAAVLLTLVAHGQPVDDLRAPGGAAPAVRFATVDVFVASDTPLAAWQFELAERGGRMTVVGVENGDSAAFGDAPYYDLNAVQQGNAERVVVADFSTAADANLPRGRTRVATIHVQLAGAQAPDYDLRLIAAGDAAGRPIDAAISLSAN